MTISAIIAWLIIGLVVGGLAHLLVPGRKRIGILLTLLFGIVGALYDRAATGAGRGGRSRRSGTVMRTASGPPVPAPVARASAPAAGLSGILPDDE